MTIIARVPIKNSYDEYSDFLKKLQARVLVNLELSKGILFRTSSNIDNSLWDFYLEQFPSNLRKEYRCQACREFFKKYADIAFVGDNGTLVPFIWSPEDTFSLIPNLAASLHRKVKLGTITDLFVPKTPLLGVPRTGIFEHFCIAIPEELINSPEEARAKSSNFINEVGMVMRYLKRYSADHIVTAINVLKSEHLYRSEKFLGVAQWFLNLKRIYESEHSSSTKYNLIKHGIASAPVGYAHVGSSMIGTLLDDIKDGLEFADIKAKFDAKMNPTKYQRPQVAPSEGNIKQAEELIARLGIESSLVRRFARIEDIKCTWLPPKTEKSSKENKGVFGHLKPKGKSDSEINLDIPPKILTWVKFERDVLPTATKIEYLILAKPMAFTAFTTANDPEAPPLLHWDKLDNRYPVSFFAYPKGSLFAQWGLVANSYVEVTGVAKNPSTEIPPHTGENIAFFILKGCVDSSESGNGIFPEDIIQELHPIRKTIEAYSRSAVLLGRDQATACGVAVGYNGLVSELIKVYSPEGQSLYRIDRWE